MDYTKLAGDMPKEQLEITGVVTVEYLVGRACTSLAGAGRIFTIFSRERVGFLRFEWLQIGQDACSTCRRCCSPFFGISRVNGS